MAYPLRKSRWWTRLQSVRNQFIDSQTFNATGTLHARVSRRASRFGFRLCDPGSETNFLRIRRIPSPQIGKDSGVPGTDTVLSSRLPIHPRGDGKARSCSYPIDSSMNVLDRLLGPAPDAGSARLLVRPAHPGLLGPRAVVAGDQPMERANPRCGECRRRNAQVCLQGVRNPDRGGKPC